MPSELSDAFGSLSFTFRCSPQADAILRPKMFKKIARRLIEDLVLPDPGGFHLEDHNFGHIVEDGVDLELAAVLIVACEIAGKPLNECPATRRIHSFQDVDCIVLERQPEGTENLVNLAAVVNFQEIERGPAEIFSP